MNKLLLFRTEKGVRYPHNGYNECHIGYDAWRHSNVVQK